MRRISGLLAGLLAAAALAGAVPLAAQAPPPEPAPATGAPAVPVPAEIDTAVPAYTYEVRGRRDPFRSLLLRQQVERTGIAGPAGMLVDELELQGTIRTKTGWIAMMRGADNRSYLLKKGMTVFDGEVIDITATEVTFRQNVNDPTNPKPFRDVVKAIALQRKP
ncbi:MAG: hypothetical protein EDX89_08855 [Acidobacteria bacterium]|nr:MAG: hypothetical protein EDX89_08855 [Acidobacteriota bacterium]